MFDTKVQTPIQTKVLEKAKTRAGEIGFSSVNDVIRILLKKFGDGNLDISVTNRDEIQYVSAKEQKEIETKLANMSKDDLATGKSEIIEIK